MITPPCGGCAERRTGCHARCAAYAEYKGKVDRAREAQQQSDSIDLTEIRRVYRARKATRRHKNGGLRK